MININRRKRTGTCKCKLRFLKTTFLGLTFEPGGYSTNGNEL